MRLKAAVLATLLPAALCAMPAFGQQPTAPVGPTDKGFFRPSSSLSLTTPEPPLPTITAGSGEAPVQEPGPATVMRWTEGQMDRSERESEQARSRMEAAPPAINGAFDGSTSERDR